MRRLAVIAAVVAAGFAAMPSSASALATCTTINQGPPAKTTNGGPADYFQAETHVRGCSAKFFFITTLLVESAGSYHETGCDGSGPPSCEKVWPTTGGDCGATLFCAYTSVLRYPTWHPNLFLCGYNYRARVYVFNSSNQEIGEDTSITERC